MYETPEGLGNCRARMKGGKKAADDSASEGCESQAAQEMLARKRMRVV